VGAKKRDDILKGLLTLGFARSIGCYRIPTK
jgi:hypothetical protein